MANHACENSWTLEVFMRGDYGLFRPSPSASSEESGCMATLVIFNRRPFM